MCAVVSNLWMMMVWTPNKMPMMVMLHNDDKLILTQSMSSSTSDKQQYK
jgi:hypothetical protein